MKEELVMELYARGERGRLVRLSVPWADLIGSNPGLLEVLFSYSQQMRRPLEVGDIVRVPRAGRYVVLSQGWAKAPQGWHPLLDSSGRVPQDFPLPPDSEAF